MGIAGDASAQTYRVVEIAGGLAHPWSLVFLPKSELLVTERNGGLRIVRNGVLDPTPIAGVPLLYWVPSIAPSGMDFHAGDRFPQWRGDLFVGALAARELRRIDLDGSRRVLGQESLLGELKQRIREVRCGPDGYVYVLTDESDGKILRLEPL